MKKQKWFAGDSSEYYTIGPCETKEEAIEEFRSENDDKYPEAVGIGRPFLITIDGAWLLGCLTDKIYENCYEDAADGWCEFKYNNPKIKELENDLNKVLHDWLDKHGIQKEFINIEEIKE